MSTALILFGATGHLAKSKLFPALHSLSRENRLPDDFNVLAIGRREYNNEAFIAHLEGAYDASFLERISYMQLDMTDCNAYGPLVAELEHYDNHAFYLSVAPSAYKDVLKALSISGAYKEHVGGWSRVILEKPFGSNQDTARELNALVNDLFPEDGSYRIDHYLGKDTVENILAFRFSNPVFESSWSAENIDHIQITSAETVGVEDRIAFYSETGTMRDVVQNHLLQLVTLLTMDQPAALDFDALSDAKMDILRNLRFDAHRSVLATYDVPETIDALKGAETYAMTAAYIDSPRWQGMPIYIRTGKRLPEKVTEVSVHFKPASQTLFHSEHGGPVSNVVTFRIQPNEGVFLRFGVKRLEEHDIVDAAQMVFCYRPTGGGPLADAYQNLFSAVFTGQQTVALRSDVIEESWRIIDDVLAHFRGSEPLIYTPDTWGPARADEILEADGRVWKVEDQDVCNGVVIN
jgi:glucose-6-phosphate 1-dehydrogenase